MSLQGVAPLVDSPWSAQGFVIGENVFEDILPFFVQVAHAEEDLRLTVVDQEGPQERRLTPLEEIVEDVDLVIIGKIDIMKMDDHPGAKPGQDFQNQVIDVGSRLDRVGGIDEEEIVGFQ